MSSIHNSPSIIRTLAVPAGGGPPEKPAIASTPGSGGINNGPATDTFSSSKPKLFTITAALATPGGITPGGVTPGGITPGGITPGGVTPGGITPGGATPGGATPGEANGNGSNKAYADMIIQALMDLDAPDDLIEAYKEQYRLLGFYDATPEGGATPGGVTPGGVTPGGIIR